MSTFVFKASGIREDSPDQTFEGFIHCLSPYESTDCVLAVVFIPLNSFSLRERLDNPNWMNEINYDKDLWYLDKSELKLAVEELDRFYRSGGHKGVCEEGGIIIRLWRQS